MVIIKNSILGWRNWWVFDIVRSLNIWLGYRKVYVRVIVIFKNYIILFKVYFGFIINDIFKLFYNILYSFFKKLFLYVGFI